MRPSPTAWPFGSVFVPEPIFLLFWGRASRLLPIAWHFLPREMSAREHPASETFVTVFIAAVGI
jgi:hypothetical protein